MPLDHLKKKPPAKLPPLVEVAAVAPPEPAPAPKAKAKTPKDGPTVTYACGHTRPLAKITGKKCGSCQEAERAEVCRARRERKAAKKATKTADRPQPPDQSRLPAGSVKHLEWDGRRWAGTLAVPGVPEAFTVEADSEKRAFHGLHDAYVAWLGRQPK